MIKYITVMTLCQWFPMTTWIPDLFKLEARVFYDVIESERGELPNEDVTVDS